MTTPSETAPEPTACYRIEVRFDFCGTRAGVEVAARDAAQQVGGEVTAIFDEI